jgi:hypothetical protein
VSAVVESEHRAGDDGHGASSDDSFELFMQDTLASGAGLCDERLVEKLVVRTFATRPARSTCPSRRALALRAVPSKAEQQAHIPPSSSHSLALRVPVRRSGRAPRLSPFSRPWASTSA